MAVNKKNKNALKKETKPDAVTLGGVNMISTENPSNVYSLYSSEFANPTPDNFRQYLEDMRKGLNFFAALLFEHIRRRDLHIKAVCQTRKLPIASKEWNVEAEETKTKKAAEDSEKQFDAREVEAAEFCEKNFKEDWFVQFIIDCVEANISGLSIFENNFAIEGDKIKLDNVKLIQNHLIVYSDKENKYYFLDIASMDVFKMKTLGYTTSEDRIDLTQIKTIDLPELKKLEVHSLDGSGGNGLLNGFIDGLMWAYIKRNLSSKDWAIFLEKHADPPVSASYDPLLDDNGRAKALQAVQSFGRSKYSTFPNTVTFTIHDTAQKGNTSTLFRDYTREHKDEISIAILGQTLTTEVSGGGSYAAAQVHELVRQDLQHADMIVVTMAANKLIKILCDLNFPGLKQYPKFKFISQVDLEFKKAVSVMIRDLRVAGFKPKAEELSALFGFTFEETNAVGAAADMPTPGSDPAKPPTKNTTDAPPVEDGAQEEDANFKQAVETFADVLSRKKTEKKISDYIKKIFEEEIK